MSARRCSLSWRASKCTQSIDRSANSPAAVTESATISEIASAKPHSMMLRCSVPANVPPPSATAPPWKSFCFGPSGPLPRQVSTPTIEKRLPLCCTTSPSEQMLLPRKVPTSTNWLPSAKCCTASSCPDRQRNQPWMSVQALFPTHHRRFPRQRPARIRHIDELLLTECPAPLATRVDDHVADEADIALDGEAVLRRDRGEDGVAARGEEVAGGNQQTFGVGDWRAVRAQHPHVDRSPLAGDPRVHPRDA